MTHATELIARQREETLDPGEALYLGEHLSDCAQCRDLERSISRADSLIASGHPARTPRTPARPRRSLPVRVLAIVGGAALVLALGIATGTTLRERQQGASPGTPTFEVVPNLPAATQPPSAITPEPAVGEPRSAGAVAEAGVLYIKGADGQIHRYEGATGTLAPRRGGTFAARFAEGVLVVGPDGDARRLDWDGGSASEICGPGTVIDISNDGNCAFRSDTGVIQIMAPRMRPRVAPENWGAGEVAWDESGARLALIRSQPGPSFEERGHNALWVMDPDGRVRELYEPSGPAAFVMDPEWSPDGRWITVLEQGIISSSIGADGATLLLVEVASGRATSVGPTIGRSWRAWSPSGELAFVRGAGRETWRDKRLVLRGPDGAERELALPDAGHVQLAPAWSAAGDLAFVIGPSGDPTGYMDGTGVGDRRGMILRAGATSPEEVRCPNGVVEGIQPSVSAGTLLLCRTPGSDELYPLSIWFVRPGAVTAVPLVTGIQSHPDARGFGFYGLQPPLSEIVAWSRAGE